MQTILKLFSNLFNYNLIRLKRIMQSINKNSQNDKDKRKDCERCIIGRSEQCE